MNDSGSSSASSGADLAADLWDSIAEMLMVLKAVGNGDFSHQLEQKYPDSHPVGALVQSINFMTQALVDARMQSSSNLDQLSDRIVMIERQREAIRNLSVPIIEVWGGVLCAPVVGVLDSARAGDVTTTLLEAVARKKARHVIIDVTGVDVMDTRTADHFLRIARAVTLLGAQCALSGMHPNIANTIVHMGVELHGLKSYRSMREALKDCVREVKTHAKRKKNQ